MGTLHQVQSRSGRSAGEPAGSPDWSEGASDMAGILAKGAEFVNADPVKIWTGSGRCFIVLPHLLPLVGARGGRVLSHPRIWG